MSSINMLYFARILEDVTFVHSLSTSATFQNLHYSKHHFTILSKERGILDFPTRFSLKIHLIGLASQNDAGRAKKKTRDQHCLQQTDEEMTQGSICTGGNISAAFWTSYFLFPFYWDVKWLSRSFSLLTLPGTWGLGQCRLVGVVQITCPYMLQGVFLCFTAVAKLTVHAECSSA